jgi:hypothetical protein
MSNPTYIKAAFKAGDINYLDAIMELQESGMITQKAAEALVCEWQSEPIYGSSALSNACEQDEGA